MQFCAVSLSSFAEELRFFNMSGIAAKCFVDVNLIFPFYSCLILLSFIFKKDKCNLL